MGVTTIWERWDGQKPDSTFQSVGMNSFNHYAYGAIGDWMYRVLAGIDIENDESGVGYKKIIIKPYIKATIIEAGENSSEWNMISGLDKKKVVKEGLQKVDAILKIYYGSVRSH